MHPKFAPIKITLDPKMALLVATFIHTEAQGNHDFYNMLSVDGRKDLMRIAKYIMDQIKEDPGEIEILKKMFISGN